MCIILCKPHLLFSKHLLHKISLAIILSHFMINPPQNLHHHHLPPRILHLHHQDLHLHPHPDNILPPLNHHIHSLHQILHFHLYRRPNQITPPIAYTSHQRPHRLSLSPLIELLPSTTIIPSFNTKWKILSLIFFITSTLEPNRVYSLAHPI